MRNLFFLFFISSQVFGQGGKELDLKTIFKSPELRQNLVYGINPLKDGKTYATIEQDSASPFLNVVRNRYQDGKAIGIIYSQKDLIYQNDTLSPGTTFSDDESKVLLVKDEEEIYRYSRRGNYFVYDLLAKKIIPVSVNGKQLFASFSPDGTKVAFVRDNNIFIKDLRNGSERQITTDGKLNVIKNGWSDWVYEEEFSFAKAFFWSPDSKRIAYYKFDESDVPQYSMTIYNTLYPWQYQYKYPKAGQKNSIVSIHIYDLSKERTVRVNTGDETDQYIPRVKWTADPEKLCVLRLNRHQNKLDYLLAEAETGRSSLILQENDKYYIDIENEQLTFLKDGKHFISLSERDGFNHIYLYSIQGKLLKQITRGNWEVTSVYGIDEKTNTLFYQSTENSPLQRAIYSIDLNGRSKRKLSASEGTNEAEFSRDFSYYILSHSTINRPVDISLYNRQGQKIRTLENNALLVNKLAAYKLPEADFFSFRTSDDVQLNGYMIKPSTFNPKQKYPVLLYVYGGPGSQSVADEWGGSRSLWFKMLAEKGYIVACVDNRGTGFRGAEFKKMTYKQLGKLETIDQIETARWFQKQAFVDSSRIGIWGWSYGGYMASLCATKGMGIFKMCIAVAPVTTWRFYDTIYTERYLQTPQENPEGYDENSPIQFAGELKGKFLLIHGTGDDNVHFQNSVMFSEALIQANKAFDQAYYPDKNHGIYGGNTTIHLYSKMTNFILTNL